MTDNELPDWDRIVELHAKRVFHVAFRILGSIQDAEDASQDVFRSEEHTSELQSL